MNTTTNSDKVIKRSIILCWVALALCFLVKICGGNFFAIAVENERFIAVCEYIDNHNIVLIAVLLSNYLLMGYIYLCAILNQVKLNKKQVLVLIPITILLFTIKMLFMYVGMILEILVLIAIPVLYKKCKWYVSTMYQILYNVFGIISTFVKDIGKIYLPDNSLIGLIFSLDVYFMLILFMLYNYKKEA